MKPAAWIGIAVAVLAGTGIALHSSPTEKPTLLLLTSLPILFGEGFTLDQAPTPVLARLENEYRVQPIDVADGTSLEGHDLLLMAHPRAQPAEALVALDGWVRRGGHVLLLADPKVDWHSEKPLGDLTRPPPSFADTGLLAHWGLALTLAPGNSAGVLRQAGGGGCAVADGGLIARCTIGKGKATIIADADFLEAGDEPGLDLLEDELSRLNQGR